MDGRTGKERAAYRLGTRKPDLWTRKGRPTVVLKLAQKGHALFACVLQNSKSREQQKMQQKKRTPEKWGQNDGRREWGDEEGQLVSTEHPRNDESVSNPLSIRLLINL